MITADQLVAHAIGDYVLQSDWMATEKTKRNAAAACHAVVYTLPFLFLSLDSKALAVIAATHYLIDRYRLARYVVWAKNFIAPPGNNFPWAECTLTGYTSDRPAWLAVWLLIIADNTMHVLINGAALQWL